MTETLNNYVVFQADFRWPDPEEVAAAQELASYFSEMLPKQGITVSNAESDEFGHYLECVSEESTSGIWIAADILIDEPGQWTIQPCAKRSLLGNKTNPTGEILPLMQAIDNVLHESERVTNIRWYPHFETPEYLALMTASDGPIRDPALDEQIHQILHRDTKLTQLTNKIFSFRGFVLACVIFFATSSISPRLARIVAGALIVLFLVFVFLHGYAGSQIRKAAKRKSP